MAQPVKLNDDLINAARECAAAAHRSLAAQVEHWATLGRAIEGSLTADQSNSLKSVVREPTAAYRATPTDIAASLAQALSYAVSPQARSEFASELAGLPQPRYGTDPAFPGCVVRYEIGGSKTPGHVCDGVFVALGSTMPAAHGQAQHAPPRERGKSRRARP